MRIAIAVLAGFLVVGPTALAQTATLIPQAPATSLPVRRDDPPYHRRDARTEIIIRSGSNLTVEPGVNDLHSPRTMVCRGVNGCEIAIVVSVAVVRSTGSTYTICSLVDGLPVKPACVVHYDYAASVLQHIKVAQGSHTVQTQFTNGGTEGTIGAWQVNYTLYEKR